MREWLGAMVTGGVVEYDRDAKTYALPAEHAACLTRAAGPDNIAAFATYIALMGKVEDGIVRSFKEGGGVPYEDFENFQELQATETGPICRRDPDRRNAAAGPRPRRPAHAQGSTWPTLAVVPATP